MSSAVLEMGKDPNGECKGDDREGVAAKVDCGRVFADAHVRVGWPELEIGQWRTQRIVTVRRPQTVLLTRPRRVLCIIKRKYSKIIFFKST